MSSDLVCPVCVNTYYTNGKKVKSTEICSLTGCNDFCVKESNMCSIHNRQRQPILCVSCNKSCCRLCYITYFLNDEDAGTKCVFCSKMFDIEFLLGNDHTNKPRFSRSFVWGELKEHREKVLFDKIMAKMPSYQKVAAAVKTIDTINQQCADIEIEIQNLYHKRYLLRDQTSIQRNIINGIGSAKSEEDAKKNSYVTRGKCPKENCNGYIEDKWECGLCNTKVCSSCMLQKNDNHECIEENVQSTKLIRDTTKPCPGCRSRIYRSEGCFAKDTEVLMYDTSVKMSQDIVIGDVLVGDDGEMRIVKELVSGSDKMYEIIQNNGENYTVNKSHTLVLANEKNEIVQVVVEEYIKLSYKKKNLLYGVKSSNGISYPEQKVELDPYTLGSWLGDGTHPIISLNDTEVQKYKLIGNKHITKEYLMNSRSIRLSLLAGIIDTCGILSNSGKKILIVHTKPDLAEQIILLARSLGFVVNVNMIERNNESIFEEDNKDYKTQYNINISSEHLSEIPTRLPRKKCVDSNTNKNLFKTKIEVKYVGVDNFYGWKLDKNSLFTSRDFTILKNCSQMYCTSCHVFFCWNTGNLIKKTQWVHNPHFFEFQRLNRINENIGNSNHEQGNVGGACWTVTVRSILNINLDKKYEKLILSNIRKFSHILDHVQRYVDNMEIKNRDISVKYLNGEITQRDLSIFIQKYNKASKKEELANLRRTTYAETIRDYLTYFHNEVCELNRNKDYEKKLELSIKCEKQLEEIESYSQNNMEIIGNMFNSNPPDLFMKFRND